MIYKTTQDLPRPIRERLPEAVQELYRLAYNSAFQWYGDETRAHQAAWSAVRSQAASPNSVVSDWNSLVSPIA